MKWLQKLIDTYELSERINSLRVENSNLSAKVTGLHRDLRVISLALGRIIAKVDPSYAESEFDPTRKAASDAAGEEVIRRLRGEEFYSNRTRID